MSIGMRLGDARRSGRCRRRDADDVPERVSLLPGGNATDKPRSWLIAIAHNVCRQRFRQAQRSPREVEFDERRRRSRRRRPRQRPRPRICGAHSRELPPNQRAALVMRELEGSSYMEIAGVLGISVSALETLLFRARRALREQLEERLSCEQAAFAIDKQLEGRLAMSERSGLRAHLRACPNAQASRRASARSAARSRALVLVPLPSGLPHWFGVTRGGAAGAAGAGGPRGGRRGDDGRRCRGWLGASLGATCRRGGEGCRGRRRGGRRRRRVRQGRKPSCRRPPRSSLPPRNTPHAATGAAPGARPAAALPRHSHASRLLVSLQAPRPPAPHAVQRLGGSARPTAIAQIHARRTHATPRCTGKASRSRRSRAGTDSPGRSKKTRRCKRQSRPERRAGRGSARDPRGAADDPGARGEAELSRDGQDGRRRHRAQPRPAFRREDADRSTDDAPRRRGRIRRRSARWARRERTPDTTVPTTTTAGDRHDRRRTRRRDNRRSDDSVAQRDAHRRSRRSSGGAGSQGVSSFVTGFPPSHAGHAERPAAPISPVRLLLAPSRLRRYRRQAQPRPQRRRSRAGNACSRTGRTAASSAIVRSELLRRRAETPADRRSPVQRRRRGDPACDARRPAERPTSGGRARPGPAAPVTSRATPTTAGAAARLPLPILTARDVRTHPGGRGLVSRLARPPRGGTAGASRSSALTHRSANIGACGRQSPPSSPARA